MTFFFKDNARHPATPTNVGFHDEMQRKSLVQLCYFPQKLYRFFTMVETCTIVAASTRNG
jgi:hypothetical protein